MQASLMITCLCDALYPNVGKAAVMVLERLGVQVDFPPGQTCCGQPAYNSGYQDDARKAALATIRAFEDSRAVISLSGSCAAMIRHSYPALFQGTPHGQEAQALADKTYEFSEYLTGVLGVESLPVTFKARAVFHNSCHTLRNLGVTAPPQKILSLVRGLQLLELPGAQNCCGFGGTFAVKMPLISTEMADEKAGHIISSGADILVSLDMSCLMNIGGRLERLQSTVRPLHIAELLGEGWE
ncbi:MAG: (Fe-S)-binding protein [Deltaproteobacteria bacterium]|nr:(Fe-S)-binding protein [Deltaproteobacteria bacterium]